MVHAIPASTMPIFSLFRKRSIPFATTSSSRHLKQFISLSVLVLRHAWLEDRRRSTSKFSIKNTPERPESTNEENEVASMIWSSTCNSIDPCLETWSLKNCNTNTQDAFVVDQAVLDLTGIQRLIMRGAMNASGLKPRSGWRGGFD